jgi:uncharacterized protein (TIGR02302 family)
MPRLAARLRLARAAIAWEHAWPAAWPALGIVAAFAVVALSDLLPLLPPWAHAATLAGFALALGAAVLWPMWHAAWPDRVAARRRIEVSSGLPHRPLQALNDRPAAVLEPGAAALWEAHQRRMATAARRLRVGWPVAGLARRDPWGLRSILSILLVLSAVDAGADWRDRVWRAVTPNLARGVTTVAASFDIWITPPEYTGLAPQFLRAGDPATVKVPTGSALLAQVHGGSGLPRLTIDKQAQDFQAVDKENFRAAATLTAGTRLSVSQGGASLGSWPIEIVPDTVPKIVFAEPPKGTARAALRLQYRASDDYGIESVKAIIRRPDDPRAGTIELELPLPGVHLKEAEATSFHDLSPHPWAGLPVEIHLAAADAPGQVGETPKVTMILPERIFTNPVARAIIDQRKELVKDPGSRLAVAEILGDLNKRPALYRDDTVVFLGISLAQSQLQRDPSPAATDAVVELLWDTALRIEDGNMSLAERDLRRLEQRLQDALARGASDAEIEELMRQMRQELDRYLQAMAQDMARRQPEDGRPLDPSSRVMTSRDLQRMLDRARELARSGAREQARDMLSQLQNMLENLRAANPQELRQRGSNQAQKLMRGMQELMQRQQQLLDRSFRAQRQQSNPGENGEQGGEDNEAIGDPGQMGDAAGAQEALRRQLGDMMREFGDDMGDIPDPLGRAERAMREAAQALKRGFPGQAIGPQTDALDQLQQGARDFARQLQQRLGKTPEEGGDENVGSTERAPRENTERDPFGRPLSSNGSYDQGDVKIPDQNTLQKAREILDELRRRAGERSRPTIELDYIDRLLRRF